jgi:exonuclease III
MFHSLELVEASPFPVEIRGYLKPSSILNLLDWRVWWFGTSFLRPGMTIARCVSLADEKTTELLIVNVHLVTGVQNPVRTKQLAFVQNRIIAAMEKFGCTEVLLCGDFNGHHDQPELNQLRAAGWVDAVAYVHQHSQNKFLTWYVCSFQMSR